MLIYYIVLYQKYFWNIIYIYIYLTWYSLISLENLNFPEYLAVAVEILCFLY